MTAPAAATTPGAVTSFLGAAADDPAGRLQRFDPAYMARAAFPVLEEVHRAGLEAEELRAAIAGAVPHAFAGDHVHAAARALLADPAATLDAPEIGPMFKKVAAARLPRPHVRASRVWAEFPITPSNFAASEEFLAAGGAANGGVLFGCARLPPAYTTPPTEGQLLAMGLPERRLYDEELETAAGVFQDHGINPVPGADAVAAGVVFGSLRFRGRADRLEERLRPFWCRAFLIWAGEWCYLRMGQVPSEDYARPLKLLPAYRENVTADAALGATIVAAGLMALGGVGEPPAAARAAQPLQAAARAASPGLGEFLDVIKPVAADLAAWHGWLDADGRAESTLRQMHYCNGMPPEPPVPCFWAEFAIHPQNVAPGDGRARRIAILCQLWTRHAAADDDRAGRDIRPFAFQAPDKPFRDFDLPLVDTPAERDRWYVAYAFALDEAGRPAVMNAAAAVGYGGGYPAAFTVPLDLAARDRLFPGLSLIEGRFHAAHPAGGGLPDITTPGDRGVLDVFYMALSALADPLAVVESRAGTLTFRWAGPARPAYSRDPAAPSRPAQNWPPERELVPPRDPAAPPRLPARPAVTFRQHLRERDADARMYEWAWKYAAVRPASYPELLAARDPRTDPEPGDDEHTLGRKRIEARMVHVVHDQDGAKARWRAAGKRDAFELAWDRRLSEGMDADPAGTLMAAAYYGGGPKLFKCSLPEFHAFRRIALRFPESLYRQPFPCVAVEFPAGLSGDWDALDDRGHPCKPVGMLLLRPEDAPGVFSLVMFSTGMQKFNILPVGTAGPSVAESDEPLVEGYLDEVARNEPFRRLPHARDARQARFEGRGLADLIRVGLNACTFLVQEGTKKLGPLDPAGYAKSQHQAAAKKINDRLRAEARNNLLTHPIVYGFHQTIRVYDAGHAHQPGDDAERTGHHVRPHYRRGCWTHQPCGEGRKDRKVIFRKSAFVNRELFGGDMSQTAVTMVRVPAPAPAPPPTPRDVPDAD